MHLRRIDRNVVLHFADPESAALDVSAQHVERARLGGVAAREPHEASLVERLEGGAVTVAAEDRAHPPLACQQHGGRDVVRFLVGEEPVVGPVAIAGVLVQVEDRDLGILGSCERGRGDPGGSEKEIASVHDARM